MWVTGNYKRHPTCSRHSSSRASSRLPRCGRPRCLRTWKLTVRLRPRWARG